MSSLDLTNMFTKYLFSVFPAHCPTMGMERERESGRVSPGIIAVRPDQN